MSDETAKTVSMKDTAFACAKCNSASTINRVELISRERVKRDFANQVYIGNAFIVCPVCGGKNYFTRAG